MHKDIDLNIYAITNVQLSLSTVPWCTSSTPSLGSRREEYLVEQVIFIQCNSHKKVLQYYDRNFSVLSNSKKVTTLIVNIGSHDALNVTCIFLTMRQLNGSI